MGLFKRKIKKIIKALDNAEYTYEGETTISGKPNGLGSAMVYLGGVTRACHGSFRSGMLVEGTIHCYDYNGNYYSCKLAEKGDGVFSLTYDYGTVYEGTIAYELIPETCVFEKLYKHGRGKETIGDYSYVGEFRCGYREGKGSFSYLNSSYDGEFKSGEPNGTGCMTYSDGRVYTGNFENGFFEGEGKMTYPDGASWSGIFRHNWPHEGEGTWRSADDECEVVGSFRLSGPYNASGSLKEMLYDDESKQFVETQRLFCGTWTDGLFTGTGVYSRYYGELTNNVPDGHGKITLEGVVTCEGIFKNGAPTKSCSFTYENGAHLEIISSSDKVITVKFLQADGECFEGDISLDSRSYTGKITFINGDTYEGECSFSSCFDSFVFIPQRIYPHGKGTLSLANGDVYEGSFDERRINDGNGVVIKYSNGAVYTGSFLYGMPNGAGTLEYSDGAIYSGNFSGGLPCGNGRLVDSSGKHFYSSNNWHSGLNSSNVILSEVGKDESVGGMVDGVFVLEPSENFHRILDSHSFISTSYYDFSIMGKRGDSLIAIYISDSNHTSYIGEIYAQNNYIYLKSGSLTLGDGTSYIGEWKNGKLDGNGKRTYPDGSSYNGEWKADAWYGTGVYVTADGITYRGVWSDTGHAGRVSLLSEGLETFGKMLNFKFFPDGERSNIYDGDTNELGEYHGKGKLSYANGDVYDGEWKNGSWFGKGVYISAEGDVYDGYFISTKNSENVTKNDTLHGRMIDGEFFAI